MAASACNFEADRNHIYQVLAVRNGDHGRSGMPLRPDWEAEREHAGTQN